MRPYFDFLQPPLPSEMQADPPKDTDRSSRMASGMPVELPQEAAQDAMLTDFIPIADPVKLELFQLGNFQEEVKRTHPDVTIRLKHNGVHMEAADHQVFEQVKDSLLEYFCQMTETHFAVDPDEAEFLHRKDVKERLQQIMKEMPATYMVLDSHVVVTALSCAAAHRACSVVKSQVAHVSIPMDSQYNCIFVSNEWSQFLQALPLSSVKVSREDIDVLTLKGMESEKQMLVTEFLTSQLESEAVVCMEPEVLKYIQAHCHRLLVDMDQVSVIPLESLDVSGFKVGGASGSRRGAKLLCALKCSGLNLCLQIYGHPVACRTAQEMLEGIVSSICRKTITVSSPGITRYLLEKDCTAFLSEMEEEFQVSIAVHQQLWEPLAEQVAPRNQSSNFLRFCVFISSSLQAFTSAALCLNEPSLEITGSPRAQFTHIHTSQT